jgi:membrane peptidoglycan carboxypeptidase
VLSFFHGIISFLHWLSSLVQGTIRLIISVIVFNPNLGPLRYITGTLFFYCIFAVFLVYIFAPIRGWAGSIWLGPQIHYASERWLGTAIYEKDGHFIGTFDPNMDSKRDLNTSGKPIIFDELNYTANPDHKSIPVHTVPDHFWNCLTYHEDRHLGGLFNPFGIDIIGVLKIPYTTAIRSYKAKKLAFGVGGSTLPMQLVRVYHASPPSRGENTFDKLRRKALEWWNAPVFFWELTRGGNMELLKQWSANHLWLAHRTGGQDLQGIEITSRIIFGKPATELSTAEQYLLASSVNKPIILLKGSDKLNQVRLDRWRYVAEVRAKACATKLLATDEQKKSVLFDLTLLANGPPEAKIQPKLQTTIKKHYPHLEKVASANPIMRANLLIPAARYAAREEMKNAYGFNWRQYVRGVDLTLDVTKNQPFRAKVWSALEKLQKKYEKQISPEYTLDLKTFQDPEAADKIMPDVIIAAANSKGEIVRYFESNDIAAYYGSPYARSNENGRYEPEREIRAIASVGKMMAAIGLANQGKDTLQSIYMDSQAHETGLNTCRRNGTLTKPRRAEVAFACSLNRPLEWRMAKYGQRGSQTIIDKFGFTMPYAPDAQSRTPASTAMVRGLVTASPRKVHQMSTVILASLTGKGNNSIPLPFMVRNFQRTGLQNPYEKNTATTSLESNTDIIPNRVIRASARPRLKQFLSAPLCYTSGNKRHGTLKKVSNWCAARNKDVRLHFAKTGTQVTVDADQTVDVWVSGGIQFSNGKAYSYVITVGTGNRNRAWATKLHSSQLATPLLKTLLKELRNDAFNKRKVKTSRAN